MSTGAERVLKKNKLTIRELNSKLRHERYLRQYRQDTAAHSSEAKNIESGGINNKTMKKSQSVAEENYKNLEQRVINFDRLV